MNRQSDEPVSEDIARRDLVHQIAQNRSLPPQPRYLLVAWILLLLLGAFFLFASLSDLVADGRSGLPSDHLEAFHTSVGMTWAKAQQSSPQITHYVTLLEVTYAVHELVFGLLFLIIVAIPFRRRIRWAWWACWVPMFANLTYTFTIAHYSTTTLVYSLVADAALPVCCCCMYQLFLGCQHFEREENGGKRHETKSFLSHHRSPGSHASCDTPHTASPPSPARPSGLSLLCAFMRNR